MFTEVIITGHSTDPLIAPVLWTACSLLQLSTFSSLLLSHSPSIPEPRVTYTRRSADGAFSAAEVFCSGCGNTELRMSSPAKSCPAFSENPRHFFVPM
jgi:hypothetical protein